MSTPVVEGYQLSPQQKRLWQLRQDPKDMPGRVHFAVLLEGPLDSDALRAALVATVNRFEILRSTFPIVPGMKVPLQVIGDVATAWVDDPNFLRSGEQLHQWDIETILSSIEQSISNEDGGSPASAILYKFAKDKQVLFVDIPGMWLDRQGIENMVRELARCYLEARGGDPVRDEPVQYAAVAEWLNELFGSQEAEGGRAYWRDKLEIERPHVPFTNTTSIKGRFQPQRLRKVIPQEVMQEITSLTGSDDDAAMKSFLLACLGILVWRLTEREDVVVGTAYDGRTEDELRDALGIFERYVPIVIHLGPAYTVNKVWQQAMASIQEAGEWQDYFGWENTFASDGKGAALDYFPLCFEFQGQSVRHVAREVTFTVIDSSVYDERFDLMLSCKRTGSSFLIDFYYDEGVVSQENADRFATYFLSLVEGALTGAEARIDDVKFLGEAERRTLLSELGSGKKVELKRGCVQHAFEEQVERTPQNTAITLQGRELTYAELNAHANRIAHRLQKLGVGPETVVALCTQRSLESVIGMLGILKAGGIYVPLDLDHPEDRLAFILKDCCAAMVVTQEKHAGMLSKYGIEVVSFDVDADLAPEEREENPMSDVAPENLAYMMYTSGSTGKPKGVGVSHIVALNHFISMCSEFCLDPNDRVLQFASLTFDVSLEQIFPTLFTGARVVMRGPESWSANELSSAIVDEGLTVVNLPPAFWHQWVQEEDAGLDAVQDSHLRLVIVGGEAMTLEALRCWLRTPLSGQRLLNAYGPTEATITATIFEIPAIGWEDTGLSTIPIGRPLINRQLYILDRNRMPTPSGIPGELYIGGDLLARSYLNRPELTAQQFVPDPFTTEPGARLYKTGDLGRYLPNGAIEYLGRIDQQVKIRGFRIELGEIEAVLGEHPAIRTVVVMAREDEHGEKRLVAYLVPHQKQTSNMTEVRCFLEARLPEYMVPSAFVFLDDLPLTTNGKVDRRALPAPDTSRPELEETFVAPRTTDEEMLARIWSEVLGIDQIGIHDTFFELGGHSLVATQVISRIRKAFQVDLPVYILFQEPTVAKLAAKIAEARDNGNAFATPALVRVPRNQSMKPSSTREQGLADSGGESANNEA